MRKTIILFSVLVVFAVAFMASVPGSAPAGGALGCPYIIELNVQPNCNFIWCSDNGSSGSFTTDRDGNYTLSDLCLGTYYFCPQCASGVYVVVVDGHAIVYHNSAAIQVGCPCD